MRSETGRARPNPVRELLLVGSMFLAYKLGRVLISGQEDDAFSAAGRVWDLERWLRLPDEATLQQLVLGADWLVRSANAYYAWVHFPATAAVLLWTYLRRPDLYRWARTRLAVLTAAGFVVHVLVPLAPPRLAVAGMVDTGHTVGPSVYGPSTAAFANQFAAMPSLHVGWAALVAVVLVQGLRGRLRWLWLLYPVTTLLVVVVTANHYWLDAAVALALLAADVALLAPRPARTIRTRLQRAPVLSPAAGGAVAGAPARRARARGGAVRRHGPRDPRGRDGGRDRPDRDPDPHPTPAVIMHDTYAPFSAR